jgi:glutathione S-transferase
VIGSLLRFGTMFKMLPERREFLAYSARLGARPGLRRTEAKDKELAAT